MEKRKPRNIFVHGAISTSFIAENIERHNSRHEIGGHSIFLGQVRADQVEGKTVSAIEYTAYEEMALEKMQAIRDDIFGRYELTCAHIFHSLGKVEAGGICLFVFTSSAHRKPAMEACSELVERIKAELPVWGKELFEDASYQWKENK